MSRLFTDRQLLTLYQILGLFMVVVGGFALAAFNLFMSLLTSIGPIQKIVELIKESGGDSLIRNSAIYLLILGKVTAL